MRAGKIGIVTVTFNSEGVLEDFLASLGWQCYSNFRVYVVDNASTDGTLRRLESCDPARFRVISNRHNAGVAAANNQGIRAALSDGCDSVLLLNNDTFFGSDLLWAMAMGLEEQRCDMVTPRIFYADQCDRVWAAGGDFQSWAGHRIRHRGKDRKPEAWQRRPVQVSYAPTCCVLFSARVFESIGYMDEAYFVYLDDVDFLFRARRAGLRLFYIPVDLWHKVSSLTGSDSPFSTHYVARNRGYFIRKHVRRYLQPLVAAGQLCYYGLRLLSGKDSRQTASLRVQSFLNGLSLPQQAAS